LLFAHGARDPDWAAPFVRIRRRIQEASPATIVELCYLELMTPSLPDAVADVARRGATQITVVPLFLAQGGHLKQDLPRILEQVRATHRQLAVRMTLAIGDSQQLTDAIADWALAQHRAGRV
jgi:sirohydrochlorin cobaltochelatase